MITSLLMTDSHLGVHKSADLWHDVTIKMFKEAVNVCKARGIKRLIHLGDFFDNRRHINIKTLYTAFQVAELLKDLEVYIIIGNHDTFYRESIQPTSLSVFDEHENIHIIDKPTILDDSVLVPWATPLENIPDARLVFGHFEISGFPVKPTYEFNWNNITTDNFTRFGKVYSGHFHIPSQKKNITYLGSTFQMDFGDVDSDRGYYILQDEKLEFIPFNEAPKYLILRTDQDIDAAKVSGNIVKLVYMNDYGVTENNRLLEEIQQCQPMQMFTDFGGLSVKVDRNANEDEKIILKNNREILSEYIGSATLPPHIKLPTLKGVIASLLREE